MKKQLTIAVAVVVLALLLYGAYELFIKDDDQVQQDPFYILNKETAQAIFDLNEKVEILFYGYSEGEIKGTEDINRIYLFSQSFADQNNKISLSFQPDGNKENLGIKAGGKEQTLAYSDFYKVNADGKKYAFDGESLIANTIFSLLQADSIEIPLRALEGFDTDGDTVISGRPFMYPNITRSDVLGIYVVNQNGGYKVYRGNDNEFYFEGAELVGYDQEMFASLIVNSTYVLARSKVKDPLDLSVYGLDDEEKATAVLSVVTLDEKLHKIIIGNKTPDNQSYYAKYYNKDFVYLLPAGDLETALLGPASSFLKAQLVFGVKQQEDLFLLDNIVLNISGEELRAGRYARIMTSSNFRTPNQTKPEDILTNKSKLTEAYTNWTEQPKLFGMTSSDGKDIYLQLPLSITDPTNEYTVTFGLVRHDAYKAGTPTKVYITYSADGETYIEAELEDFDISQSDETLKYHTVKFTSEAPIMDLRLHFGIKNETYLVMDEITVLAGKTDAQPVDGIVGGYRITRPEEYIPAGKNFVYPNSLFQSDFINSIATLSGDRVVDFGITKTFGNAEELDLEKLAQYGLDNPEIVVSYDLYGTTTTIYISGADSEGNYYCYSVISVEEKGKVSKITTDIIAQISKDSISWLSWDLVDYLEKYILSMYIDSIDKLTLTFDGTEYPFDFYKGENEKLEKVTYNGKEVDLPNFRQLYVSIIRVNLKGEYEEEEGSATEMLRIKVQSPSKSPEIVFYRVTTSKAYYTIDGEGKYYVLVDEVNTIKNNVNLLISGKDIPKR